MRRQPGIHFSGLELSGSCHVAHCTPGEGGFRGTRKAVACPICMAVAYARRVALLACPFCREMFEQGEAKSCPVCAMALAKFEDLPPSIEATHDEGGVPTAPEMEVLRFRDLSRGKGIVIGLAFAGI